MFASIWFLDFECDALVEPFVPTAIVGEFKDVSEELLWPRRVPQAAVERPSLPAPAGVPHLKF